MVSVVATQISHTTTLNTSNRPTISPKSCSKILSGISATRNIASGATLETAHFNPPSRAAPWSLATGPVSSVRTSFRPSLSIRAKRFRDFSRFFVLQRQLCHFFEHVSLKPMSSSRLSSCTLGYTCPPGNCRRVYFQGCYTSRWTLKLTRVAADLLVLKRNLGHRRGLRTGTDFQGRYLPHRVLSPSTSTSSTTPTFARSTTSSLQSSTYPVANVSVEQLLGLKTCHHPTLMGLL